MSEAQKQRLLSRSGVRAPSTEREGLGPFARMAEVHFAPLGLSQRVESKLYGKGLKG